MTAALKTLIIDDDVVDRRQIKRLMSKAGLLCSFDEACDGDTALRLVTGAQYDCVFLDHRLPDQTGVELLPKLRAQHEGELPIVVLTGSGDETVAVASLQGGAQHYLNKQSLDANSLRTAVNTAIERAAETASLQRLSLYDSITGLANRNLFQDRISQMTRTAERTGEATAFALLYMDLDRFKAVNDLYGHEAGDHALHCVAERLGQTLRQSDTLARLGGDEFAAILATTTTAQGAVAVAEKFAAAMREPMNYQGTPLDIGLSIGIAMYPIDANDPDALVRCADKAMYQAKRGDVDHALYAASPAPDTPPQPAPGSPDLAGVVYEPIVDLLDGSLHGVQTLVQHPHPELGVLPALPLTPLAENPATGVATACSLLEAAIRQAQVWSQTGIHAPLTVAIPAFALDRCLVDRLGALLRDCHVPPSRLVLEIAEWDLLQQPAAHNSLRHIVDYGVQLCVGEFATSHSSLHYLSSLPIAAVRLSPAFVRNLVLAGQADAVLTAIADHTEARAIQVVAEGVDCERIRDALVGAGCRIGQGLLWSGPVAADAIAAFFRQRAPRALAQPHPVAATPPARSGAGAAER